MSKKKQNGTYIKVWRKALDNDLFCKKPFDDWHAFEWMLMRARFSETDVLIKRHEVHLYAGQLIISYDKLAKEFGWSRNKVIRYLGMLSELKMVTLLGTKGGTIITIENYTKYQVDGYIDEPISEHISGTISGTTSGTRKNNVNKECIKNNEKECISEKSIYGEFQNVKLTSDEYEKLKAIDGCDDLIERLSAYKASTGKTYKSDYATILNWHRKDGNENHRNDNSPKGKKNGTDEPVDKYAELYFYESGL